MRSILIVLILVGVVKGLSGTITNAKINDDARIVPISNFPALSEPRFTNLNGNLFMVIETNRGLDLEDGAIIEFDFGKKKKLKSFHVNDVNQDILDNGDADLLVMVHQDLALALKNDKLIKLKIMDGADTHSFPVGQLWQPHAKLSSL